jgi:hypothetical protein
MSVARTAPAADDEPAPVVDEPVEVPAGKVISFADESDHAYRQLLELHQPDTGGER